jgi:hypothetical protein
VSDCYLFRFIDQESRKSPVQIGLWTTQHVQAHSGRAWQTVCLPHSPFHFVRHGLVGEGIRCSLRPPKTHESKKSDLYSVLFFVISPLLFKCVLYYCHRVSTQLQLTNIAISIYVVWMLLNTSEVWSCSAA